MKCLQSLSSLVILWLLVLGATSRCEAQTSPDFDRHISPILTRYCAGCHNEDDREGMLSLETFDGLQQGGENGPVLSHGNSQASRLIQVLTGNAEPAMPPDGEPSPTAEEIELLRRWIDAGAVRTTSSLTAEKPLILPKTPRLGPSGTPKPITAVAFSPDATRLAVARYRTVELLTADDRRFVQRLAPHPGKVNDVRFTHDGAYLIAATGVVGVSGEARVWDLRTGELSGRLGDHRDVIYAAVPSHDGRLLATAGYDRVIMVWNLATGDKVHELTGHNGPIFDLAFTPDDRILTSASGDATVKVWRLDTGQRLDTLSQPLKEQYSVDVSPDGQFIVAAGEDNRVRLWRLVSLDKPRINPLLIARFGHEQGIDRVRFTDDGRYVVSLAADRQLKVWNASDLVQVSSIDVGPDVAQALSIDSSGMRVAVGGMDGALLVHRINAESLSTPHDSHGARQASGTTRSHAELPLETALEEEPNDHVDDARPISVPARIAGTIFKDSPDADVDTYRFHAKQGEKLILEIRAARDNSPLDSKLTVLTAEGKPVPRVLLRAVRDSYFTFRGKDSNQTGDFRLHNWQEMRVNQLLYASGEVVKLYHYPRGPDSGFNVHPNFGNRHTFFDTTAVAHALHEPCYIVEAFPPGTELPPNGLPTFLLNYENDDESQRRYGSDSYLTFTAPEEGDYVVRVEDVRRSQGPDFRYELIVRPPQPDFRMSIMGNNPSVPPGAGRKFELRLERIDGFDGEVRVRVEGLPPGFQLAAPIVVEPGQLRAYGTLIAAPDAVAPDEHRPRLVASAKIGGTVVEREVGSLGEIKVGEPPKLLVHLSQDGIVDSSEMPVIEVQAGTTTTAKIRIDRRGHTGRVGFGKEDAVFNAPHGVYVDNIGLNGVLITESQNERMFYITVEPWVSASERVVFVEAEDAGSPTSNPVLLRIKARDAK